MPTPDFRVAAKRHYDDGLLLSGNGRLPGADHFFGISAECAIKAALQSAGVLKLNARGRPEKPFDKHCPDIWNEYQVQHGGNARLGRFPLPKINPFDGNWKVDDRYADGGAITPASLESHRSGAFAAQKLLEAIASQGQI